MTSKCLEWNSFLSSTDYGVELAKREPPPANRKPISNQNNKRDNSLFCSIFDLNLHIIFQAPSFYICILIYIMCTYPNGMNHTAGWHQNCYLPESEEFNPQSTYILEYHSVCPTVGIGTTSPAPLPPASVYPPSPHWTKGDEVEESQFWQLDKKLWTLSTLWFNRLVQKHGMLYIWVVRCIHMLCVSTLYNIFVTEMYSTYTWFTLHKKTKTIPPRTLLNLYFNGPQVWW